MSHHAGRSFDRRDLKKHDPPCLRMTLQPESDKRRGVYKRAWTGMTRHQNATMASNKSSTATTPTIPAAGGNLPQQIGIIPEFCGDTDDWTVYREILEEFFKANGVLENNKVSVLISVIGADTYRTLRDLCHPDSPKDKTYEQLCGLLAKQFIPEIAIFRERAKFYRAEQRRGEDVKAWYARLKKLSVECNFGEHLERLLLDKFVVGLAPGPVSDRLCEENESITLKEAIDLAANRESAVQDENMAEDLGDLSLGEHRRGGHRRHGRRHHHHGGHHHFGPHGGRPGGFQWGPPGFGHMMDMGFGHGPARHHPHPHRPHPHGHGPMERRGPPALDEFYHGLDGGRCPFRQRGREMKRCARKWRKHHGRRSSSSSSSSSESSGSSSSSSDEEENKRRKCRKGHKKGHRHGGHGHGWFGHGGPKGKHGHRGRCGRKQPENAEAVATENTEPELIE